ARGGTRPASPAPPLASGRTRSSARSARSPPQIAAPERATARACDRHRTTPRTHTDHGSAPGSSTPPTTPRAPPRSPRYAAAPAHRDAPAPPVRSHRGAGDTPGLESPGDRDRGRIATAYP